jgi:hypothetical protein
MEDLISSLESSEDLNPYQQSLDQAVERLMGSFAGGSVQLAIAVSKSFASALTEDQTAEDAIIATRVRVHKKMYDAYKQAGFDHDDAIRLVSCSDLLGAISSGSKK